ncbi:hypothetical protein [Fluviicola sp.]|uniref:hypothetical protein n=1 Tax=Fluviicola sp. TaxID=1917219 RepID=UPI0031DC5F67
MRKTILAFVFVCSVLGAHATTILPACKRLQVAKYDAPTGALSHAFIPMRFGKAQSTVELTEKLPAHAEVIAVDIVYTDFPKGRSFDVLNEKRAQTLLELYPVIRKSNVSEWNLVAQTECENLEEAAALFHGVVVHYRVPPTIESMKSEISFLKTVGAPSKPESKTMSHKSFERTMGASTREVAITGTGTDFLSGTAVCATTSVTPVAGSMVFPNASADQVIANVFNRNKWKNMTIAADITGSMSPYTGQLLLWLALQFNNEKVKQITFFNDGDRKTEAQKQIGQIGGIYQTATCDIETVRKLAIKAMTGGCGGDGPENNIEGLLKAYQSNPGCKELILVADALAPVKDIRLLEQVKVPVRVVLCGTYYGLHPDYLLIAAKTGGSVHTIEDDILNLATMKEGETFKISGRTYQITKGTFILIKNS